MRKNVIFILLIVNIISTCYLFSRLNKITTSIQIIGDETQTIMNKISEVDNSVHYLKKYNNWISEIDVEYGGVVNENKSIKFSWEIKDFASNSDVKFYYRRLGEDNFNILPVSFSGGKYFSLLEINIEGLGPDWSLLYTDKKEPYGFKSGEVSPYTYEYYVEFIENDMHLISELEQRNLSKLVQVYATIDMNIKIERDKVRDILFELKEGKVAPKSIILEKYYGDKVIEENIEIDISNNRSNWESKGKSFDKLVVRVEYHNGQVFSEEIWSK
ncbi:hypothetical protein [Tissierella sp. Yu-01]|uniref:hypothetical protein n=1 Tax=Tissierella sp. Yu-01 TaxID=3035694 RepID=UPI00240DC1E8|nr:hypothetical protein [Tissierella sp. Yu-01]WFA08731.1 hypothetical protein P3962_13540 [Tissierella sp. Yu-01]